MGLLDAVEDKDLFFAKLYDMNDRIQNRRATNVSGLLNRRVQEGELANRTRSMDWQMQQKEAQQAQAERQQALQAQYMQSQHPELASQYEAFPGQTVDQVFAGSDVPDFIQKAEFYRDNDWARQQAMDMKRAGSTNINVGGWKPEAGMRKDPNDPNKVIPIEGGSVDRKGKGAINVLQAVSDSLDSFETVYNDTGTEYLPTKDKGRLGASYTTLQMQMKELLNLGVLSGPDLELLQSMIADPTSLWSQAKGKPYFDAQIGEVRKFINNKLNLTKEQYDIEDDDRKKDLEKRAKDLGL